VWPDQRVVRLVDENFIPARVHVRDQAADFTRFAERYGAPWTPTTLLLNPDGVERHRIEGFLPVEDFLGQLILGLGHLAFHAGKWSEAERRYGEVAEKFPGTDAAPEALYWAGVARYKAGQTGALAETAKLFKTKYVDSAWAKKASVWAN